MIYRFGAAEYDLTARTYIMGIVNVTPDSFFDGGKWTNPQTAIDHALRLAGEGADFIDIGGESTRPGAGPVPAEEEIRRVLPVIEGLAGKTTVPISIDTTKSAVADRALDAGAVIVNDISGLQFDPALAGVAARRGASVVLMHIRGTPGTMQLAPHYDDLLGEIAAYFGERIAIARKAGIRQLVLDPGIGFGKTAEDNLEIIRRLGEFREFGLPLMVGPSRKSFLGAVLGLPAEERLEGTAAAVAISIVNGAHIVRVHDVRAMKRVSAVADAIAGRTLPQPAS